MSDEYVAPSIQDDFPPSAPSDWREEVSRVLKGASFEKVLVSDTYEQIKLQPIYTRHDVPGDKSEDSLPGLSPYLRGTRAAGYCAAPWLIAQEIRVLSLTEFNLALRDGIKNGQSAVRLLLDQATLNGLDSDQAGHEMVFHEGLPFSTIDDVQHIFQSIALNQIPVQIKTGSSGLSVASMFLAYCRQQHVPWESLRLSVETDPVREWVRSGKLATSLDQVFHEMTTMTAWAEQHLPLMRTVGVDVNPYHNAGANAVQELALALATGVAYIKAMISRGLSINQIAPRMTFSFGLGAGFFMEMAKLRAARILWNKVITSLGGDRERAKMYIHGQTSLWNKTVYDPYNNILRTTTETFAGILGGCDSIHTGSFDELMRSPNAFSRRIARNIQLILREECYSDRVVDPAGGSWYVETLTRQLSEKAWNEFREIEKSGGIIQALKMGIPQKRIAEVRDQRLANLSRRKDKLIGINAFPGIGEKIPEGNAQRTANSYAERRDYLKVYRTTGDINRHLKPLEKLMKLCDAPPGERMDAVIEAALCGATIGEITTTLRSDASPEASIEAVPSLHASMKFESLRQKVESAATIPSVFLANMGPRSQHKSRSDFSMGFFQVAGYNMITNPGFRSVDEAAKAALESNAAVIVICSTDETYPDIVHALSRKIKAETNNRIVLLAGNPGEHEQHYRKAGVDAFIHLQTDVFEFFESLSARLGAAL